ncbi:hypothetical protein evm_006680 [Chilo suppressalis]|nr:hypothetical protein evm_006680 [Chilo suppressalis]
MWRRHLHAPHIMNIEEIMALPALRSQRMEAYIAQEKFGAKHSIYTMPDQQHYHHPARPVCCLVSPRATAQSESSFGQVMSICSQITVARLPRPQWPSNLLLPRRATVQTMMSFSGSTEWTSAPRALFKKALRGDSPDAAGCPLNAAQALKVNFFAECATAEAAGARPSGYDGVVPGVRGGGGQPPAGFMEELGPRLQEALLDRQKETDNWITEWWLDDMYLKIRLPLPINSNPGMVFPKRHFAKMDEVADLGALFIDDLLDYKEMLDRGELPLERATSREKGQPLCMEQFYRLLGVCRVPEVGKDRLELPEPRQDGENEELVVVACRNYCVWLALHYINFDDLRGASGLNSGFQDFARSEVPVKVSCLEIVRPVARKASSLCAWSSSPGSVPGPRSEQGPAGAGGAQARQGEGGASRGGLKE